MTMVTKIAVAAALVAFIAVPSASFAASKKSQSNQQESVQRGPYTPDIKTTPHGASHDFQGGSQYYKRSKTTKHHHSHSPS
jgi:Ni/Co efflux regulator RcnB